VVSQHIDLVTTLAPPAVEIVAQTAIEPALQQLRHSPGFEQGAAHWMGPQVFRVLDRQQVRRHAAVEKVELGRLDQPLAEVDVVGCRRCTM
jgi:hypothetical protein